MNDESKKQLDEILSKEPAALTDADREFLMARRDYLTADQKVTYGITDEEPVEADETDGEASDESEPSKPAKKSAKKSDE